MAVTAITPQTLEPDTFARKVIEDRLEVHGPFSDGYLYAARPGHKDDVLYRTLGDAWDNIPVSVGATADPAAGSDPADITVPAGKRWKVRGLFVRVTNDANAANRRHVLSILTDGTNVHGQTAGGTNLVANWTTNTTFAVGGSAVATFADGTGAYSEVAVISGELILPAGAIMRLDIANIQVGDNAGPLRYTYQEVDA